MKVAVLAEKPSVGRDLARVLGCKKDCGSYIEGEEYIVTWALGHLVTLADPEEYSEEKMQLSVIRQTNRQYQKVKEQLRRADVAEIVIATDAGREGELVARWIIEKANVKKPLKRLWISSVTDKAIKEGFKNLRDGKAYEPLYHSAEARAEADWYVGINATRALTCKFNAQLSCGRVQTPTLAIIAKREQEIKNFVPQPYYNLKAMAKNIAWSYVGKGGNKNIKDEKAADLILAALHGRCGKITAVKRADKKTYAPTLYNLTDLQRDANSRFGYSAKETLSIMQKLYETHKILTYPRTDSKYISDDIVPTIKERLRACGIGAYTKLAFRAAQREIKISPHFVDNAKVSDHHAIIPTEQFVNIAALSDKERKIYDLVVRRFIAVLYPPYVYEKIEAVLEIGGEEFAAQGKRVKDLGWREIYAEKDAEESQNIADFKEGDTFSVDRLIKEKHFTKPPQPFNEGTLLEAMENPVRYMDKASGELKKALGEAGGLGTVATRADIIEKLFASFLIEKRGNDIFTTAKGRQLLELVPEDLRRPELTAEWEQKLAGIANKKLDKDFFIASIKEYAKNLISEIKASGEKFRHDNLTRKKCPDCGKFLLEVNGKRGKMLVCQERECGYKKSLAIVTNARCPECHKKMELRGEGAGKSFYCACGYREHLTAFQKRRAENSKAKVSKKDVARFMKSQSEESVNTALADALSKLKLK
jgi:DNA topoisomerase-3